MYSFNKYNNNSNSGIEMQTEPENFTDEDDSIISSLPDMSEIENYDNSQKSSVGGGICHLSQRSSISSVSSTGSTTTTNTDTSQQIVEYANGQQTGKRVFNRNIHCVKEKIRRDRIKYSCNELRRLIPNLNGVKTDMASLLETSVLWIQLINANIPDQLLINVQSKLENLKLMRNADEQQQQNSQTSNTNIKIHSKDSIHNLKQETYNPLPNNNNAPFMPETGSNFSYNNNQQQQPKSNAKPSKWLYSNHSHINSNNIDITNEHRCFNMNNEFDSDPSYYQKIAKKPIDYNNNSMYLGDHLNFTGNHSQQQQQALFQQTPETQLPIVYYNNHPGQQMQTNNLF